MATFSLYNYTGNNYRSWYSINDGAEVTYYLTLSNQNLNGITMTFGNPDAKISKSLSEYISWEISGADSDSGSFTIGSLSNNSSWTAGSTYSKTIYPNISATSGTIYLTLSSSYRATSENTGLACSGSNWSASTSSAIPSSGSITLYFNKGIVSSTTSFPSTRTLTSSYKSSGGYYQAYYTLPSASATGYTFNGWSKSNDNTADVTAGTYQSFTATGTSASTTLYACWTAQTYTISYNANGGSGAPSSQTKTHNVTLTLSPTKPARVGYEFLGWATSSTATSATYSAGGSYTSNASATLYAVWKAKEYSVLYNGNGGVHSATGEETWEDTTNKFAFGKQYDISLEILGDKGFKYSGYNLLGWNTSWTATEPLTTLKIEKDEQPKLYAIWELGSNIRVYTNENWQIAIPYIYENGEWKLSISKVFNDGEWRQ